MSFQTRPLYDSDTPSPATVTYRPSRFQRQRPLRGGRGVWHTVRRTLTMLWRRLWPLVSRRRVDGSRVASPLKMGGWFIGMVTLVLITQWISLPNIDDPQTLFAAQSTVILDRNGTELYRLFSEQDRTYVPSDQISDNIKTMTIAIEDERFFDRGCFDPIGFTRAVLSQVLPGILVRSGGSTLTQQFAKNALVGRQQTVLRKVRELMLACKLERRYNKDQLLELYLNWIPYGSNAYGVEQASRKYFGIHAKDLSVAQAAVLAAIPQLPSYYNPYGKHLYTVVPDAIERKILDGSITSATQIADNHVQFGLLGHMAGTGAHLVYVGGRTDQVLKNALDQGRITKVQYDRALADLRTITFQSDRESIRAPHFVLSIEKQVETLFGLSEEALTRGGFRITTTLDWALQQLAEKVVSKHKDDVLKRFGAHNAALVSVLPDTKEVVAYVGNSDYGDEQHEGKIDMVRAPRQPGSSFKPFVYATAFEAGYGPGTVIYDVETKFGNNTPQNYEGDFWGLLTMRTALAGSRNIPAIKAFFLAGGEEKVLSLVQRMGIVTPSLQRADQRKTNADYQYGYPLAIGSAEVPLWEMVSGYATLADGGQFAPLQTIIKITDRDGNILPIEKPTPAQEVLDARIAAQLTSVLSDAASRPNNDYWKSILSVPGYQAAAKTGTSNKCLETSQKTGDCTKRKPESTWTMGYTPGIVTGVWVGNATSQSLADKADGLTAAAPIWNEYMRDAARKVPNKATAFVVPSGITQPLISRLSGQLVSACTPIALRQPDLFLQENTPTTDDPACVMLKIDKVTGLLSSPNCPADAVEERPFFLPTSESPTRWPSWEQAVQDWAKAQMVKWDADPVTHSGSLLPLPLPPTKECDASLTPGRTNKPTVQILSPTGGASAAYPAFQPQIAIHSLSQIKKAEYRIDDKPMRTVDQAPFALSLRVPKSISKEGSHTLTVIITDEYFNTATDTASFHFTSDSRGPQVSLIHPTDGQQFTKGDRVTIEAQATDGGAVEWIELYLDRTLLTTKRDAPYAVSYPLEAVGTHTIRAVAKDSAGNTSEDAVEITVGDMGVAPVSAAATH